RPSPRGEVRRLLLPQAHQGPAMAPRGYQGRDLAGLQVVRCTCHIDFPGAGRDDSAPSCPCRGHRERAEFRRGVGGLWALLLASHPGGVVGDGQTVIVNEPSKISSVLSTNW